MFAILHSLAMFVIDFFKSPRRLEAENLFLRHQLSIGGFVGLALGWCSLSVLFACFQCACNAESLILFSLGLPVLLKPLPSTCPHRRRNTGCGFTSRSNRGM